MEVLADRGRFGPRGVGRGTDSLIADAVADRHPVSMPMSSAEAKRVVRQHFEGLFPRDCANCGRHFDSLRDYILSTTRLGAPTSIDAELRDWDTKAPIGTLAFANCPCGSTM